MLRGYFLKNIGFYCALFLYISVAPAMTTTSDPLFGWVFLRVFLLVFLVVGFAVRVIGERCKCTGLKILEGKSVYCCDNE